MWGSQVLFLVSGLGAVVDVRPKSWQTFFCSLVPESFQSAQLWS